MPQNRQLKRLKVSVAKMEDGRYVITPPQHKGLILTGGGAKGIAYGGMIRAMDDYGQLKQLTHVSGASAGAITASFLAVGMSSENIELLASELDPTKLLDRVDYGIRAKGDRFRNMLDLVYMVQIKEYLEGLAKPIPPELVENYRILISKIALYENALVTQGLSIERVNDIIKLSQNPAKLVKLDSAFAEIPQQSHNSKGELLESLHFTLGDLGLLRELLPEKDKHLIKNLSVSVTNQSKNALERYSEDATPQQPIAQVVQWSAAHPLLFVPGINGKGEYVADGGILDNMPEIDGLDREEVLCGKVESENTYNDRVKKADESNPIMLSGFKRAVDSLVQSTLGGSLLNSRASTLNREKVFHHIENMVFINTGEVTTINTSPTKAQKKLAIRNGYEQTKALLESQTKIFDHPLLAVLYVGFDQLDHALLHEDTNSDLFYAAAQAKKITFLQKAMADDINAGAYRDIPEYLKQIEDVLDVDAHLSPEQKLMALALCQKQVNFLSDGKLVIHLNEKSIKNQQWAVNALASITQPVEWVSALINDEKIPHPVREIPSNIKDNKHRGKATLSNYFFKSESEKSNEVSEEDEAIHKKPGSSKELN